MGQRGITEAPPVFQWTPFSHGFVFWEYPGPDHLPPSDEMGQREWLEGFQQAHADDPDDPDNPEGGETAADALRRMLPGNPHLPALLALIKLGHARLARLAANRPANSA